MGLGSAGTPHRTSLRLRAEPGPSRAGSTACRAAKVEGSRPEPNPGELQHQPSPRLLAHAATSAGLPLHG